DDAWFFTTAVAGLGALALYGIAGVRGIGGITSKPPDGLADSMTRRVRVVAYPTALAGWFFAPIGFSLTVPTWNYGVSALCAIWGLVALTGTGTLLQYCRYLASRLPDRPLAGQTRAVMLGLTLAAGVKVAAPVLLFLVWTPARTLVIPAMGPARSLYSLMPLG